MTDEFDFEGRKPGRPKTGRKPTLRATVRADLLNRVTDYADANFMAFGEAVERLLEKGLADDDES